MRRSGSAQFLALPLAQIMTRHLKMPQTSFSLRILSNDSLSGDRSLTSLLFISSDNRRKGTKEDFYPQGPLQRGMQPLLHVALSLRYARTIKGPAYFFDSLPGDRSLTAPTSGDWWESVDIEQKKVLLFEKDIVTLQR